MNGDIRFRGYNRWIDGRNAQQVPMVSLGRNGWLHRLRDLPHQQHEVFGWTREGRDWRTEPPHVSRLLIRRPREVN